MTTFFSARKNNTSGVTLIELLAVILIAGLLAAVSVPAFNALLKGTALNTAANSLTDTLALARQFAITFRYEYHVELDDELTLAEKGDRIDDYLQEQRYRIYFVDRDAPDPNYPRDDDKITVRKWRLLPKSVNFDEDKPLPHRPPPDEIVFTPMGGAYELWPKWIQPKNFLLRQVAPGTKVEERKVMTIKVDGITGRAKADFGDTTAVR